MILLKDSHGAHVSISGGMIYVGWRVDDGIVGRQLMADLPQSAGDMEKLWVFVHEQMRATQDL